ncbi:MAG: LacI family DNA-binding transcriptional regulator [Selenomonas sp.]|uniref:LacI family DNA-binding transcriptional regulator n=1 Tax=Selenomonas sp. TaxID=2053611 RepID=UPI0025CC57BF|nr:LacI family DNA-binding transcriptional regulator [Selenomonas sp.]MCR5439166.1 LacI family DNA-binding transcriptional regulator [Selenomonas sp.]
MDQKVTIKEVAELAGVSKSTVSRYLNHGYISLEKQERVRAAIEKTGFQSNFFAKRLKTKESKLIGIVLPRMDSVTVGKLLAGISRVLEPAGYQGILLVSQLSSRKELENIRNLQQQGVDGILVDSVGITEEHVKLSQEGTIPILYTGQKNAKVPFVKIDDEAAGRMMGAYLRQMGHKHAVFAGVTEQDTAVGIDRKRGFIDAFKAGRFGAKVNFIETGFDFLSAYNRAEDVLRCKASVVVGATDNISLGILRYIHERGIRVPEEISVVGFGGYEVGAVVYPALTTVAFDYELVGMKAAQYMLDLLREEPVQENMEMPLFFVERESVRNLKRDYEKEKPGSMNGLA